MSLLPQTEGELLLYQGRDCSFNVSLIDEATKQPQLANGFALKMQIRASIDADVILDCAPYITSSPTALSADILIPGGISGALPVDRDYVDWVADAKFVETGSSPERATDAGRFTVHFFPEITR